MHRSAIVRDGAPGLARGTHCVRPEIPVRNWDIVLETWREFG